MHFFVILTLVKTIKHHFKNYKLFFLTPLMHKDAEELIRKDFILVSNPFMNTVSSFGMLH